ncbi:MAG: glycosyltransferase family 4 protein [Candidatus Aenigmatarchaeota archaeon]|nr:MAG: glycosyltransferase family 4 protein [Candidatus Aenigmarchaeota archaeon]
MIVTLRKGNHSAFDDLVRYPPAGVNYDIPGSVTVRKNDLVTYVKKRVFVNYLKLTRSPQSVYVPQKRGSQLIHACSGIIPLNASPWVIDMEHVNSFVGFEAGRRLDQVKGKVERYLASDYCRKILPWSEAAKRSVLNGLDTRAFAHKIEVVYPAMAPLKNFRKKKHDVPTMLYIGNNFYEKGAREVVNAFLRVRKSMDARLRIVSWAPREFVEKYGDVVEFCEPIMPRSRIINEFYATADLFVLPSYHDTFGMVYEEAMATATPVVATDVFAIPEILGDAGSYVRAPVSYYNDKNLFKWDSWKSFGEYVRNHRFPKFEDKLVKTMTALLESPSARKKMAREGLRRVRNGPVSIKARNARLRRIYEEAAS